MLNYTDKIFPNSYKASVKQNKNETAEKFDKKTFDKDDVLQANENDSEDVSQEAKDTQKIFMACMKETSQVSDVEIDGRMLNQCRDPPGQNSIYVIPGDPERESYRLATFKDYPRTPVNVLKLARAGFYFTGYKDRVKCFSCGQCVGNWNSGDDPTLRMWHRENCELANGFDQRNLPIGTAFRHSAAARLRSTPPATPPSHQQTPPMRQRRAGDVLTSGLNLSIVSNAQPNHAVYQTATVAQTISVPPPSVLATTSPNANISQSLFSEVERIRPTTGNASFFPCHHPINPHMRSEEMRLQTFLDHSRAWPGHRIRATPQDIARAGMFYLGERDRVKCWYCNGGLQNWERDDVSIEEHAKWYPMCEFVLQMKGVEYVSNLAAQFPNLRRPIIHNPSASSPAYQLARRLAIRSDVSVRKTLRPGAGGPVIIDPREEQRAMKRKIDEEMATSDLIFQARTMGFKERSMRLALKRQFETNNQTFSTFHGLVEAILSVKNTVSSSDDDEEMISKTSSPSNLSFSGSIDNITTAQGIEEIRRLEAAKLCKKCGREQAQMVFMPCGHLVCCVSCGETEHSCPVCHGSICDRNLDFRADGSIFILPSLSRSVMSRTCAISTLGEMTSEVGNVKSKSGNKHHKNYLLRVL